MRIFRNVRRTGGLREFSRIWSPTVSYAWHVTDEAIAKDVMIVLNYGDEFVSVAFEDVDAADWAAKVYQPDIANKSALLYKKPRYTM